MINANKIVRMSQIFKRDRWIIMINKTKKLPQQLWSNKYKQNGGENEDKANSAQLKMELGLSLAILYYIQYKQTKMFEQVSYNEFKQNCLNNPNLVNTNEIVWKIKM